MTQCQPDNGGTEIRTYGFSFCIARWPEPVLGLIGFLELRPNLSPNACFHDSW
jgi:hypothetical protein